MTNITIYDEDAKTLDDFSEEHDTSIAEIISILMDYLDELDFS